MIRVFVAGLCLIFAAGCGRLVIDENGLSIKPFEPKVVINDDHDNGGDPTPIVVSQDFRCLIIEDSANRARLPREQFGLLNSGELRSFLRSNCIQAPASGDTGIDYGYRIVDKADSLTGVWSGLLGTNTTPTSYPWIVLVRGNQHFSGPLPATWVEAKKLLDGFAGVGQ